MDYPDEKRFTELTLKLLVAYKVISNILRQLPVPIGIPALGDDWTPVHAVEAIENTRVYLVEDEPLSEGDRGSLGRMLLDWLSAYETGTMIKQFGPAPFRFDGMEYALQRIGIAAEILQEEIGIDPDDEGEIPEE